MDDKLDTFDDIENLPKLPTEGVDGALLAIHASGAKGIAVTARPPQVTVKIPQR